ncbi:ABC transporter permease [Proteiniphilum sp. X52]|uniref:ABC transporter permease n=1 Tax=Proteiniphilum sp. X52 TaxID=2382159 RepID=UPI001314009A|nr:ABC transporter permease [Proteiniphilum sp. X52]
MNVLRQFKKNLSLRIVNLVGLSIMFACILLSLGFINRELSYDRHHTNSDRIVRLSLQFNDDPIDGRIYGNTIDNVLQQIPEIDRIVKMFKINTAVLTYQGNHHIVNDLYMVNREFLEVFDIPLIQGVKNEVLQRKGQVLVSESFARQLFGEISFDEIQLSEFFIEGQNFLISGIFKDIPETSHFRTDFLLYLPDNREAYTFTYLLLKDQTDVQSLAQKITTLVEEKELFHSLKLHTFLMPLTDIHLHSHNLREMSINGNIHYIYLIIGANVLLLIVVLFNVWLNANLMFSYNRRYYQILRLHGASSLVVFKDEVLSASLCGILSIIIGLVSACCVLLSGFIPGHITIIGTVILCGIFLLSIIVVSLLPVIKSISYTSFLNTTIDVKPIGFSHINVKWMLTIQYAVVMIVVILAFGINKQMNLVKDIQVGGNERTILVTSDQPEQVRVNFDLLKTELLKHVEIEAVTTAFQLPGDAIRDVIQVRRENNMDWQQLPIMVVGEDFLPFFNIKLIEGREFAPAKYDYQTEEIIFSDHIHGKQKTEHIEEYVINRKALAVLGFNSPDEAIGEILQIEHGTIDYFQRGVIVGVTDDFNYTGLYQETIPLMMMQRRLFQYCIMVRFDQDRFMYARTVFEKIWNDVNSNYSANYVFMNDVFNKMYHNEMSAQQLVYFFSLLCFCITDLGLIVFMAFIIRRRKKEIALRKVHGASVSDIIRMLNMDFIRYMALAFVITIPVAWYIMHRWLERFAYRTSLDWWLFVLAGFIVLIISYASVSLQCWRAATVNPAEAIAKS